MELGVAPAAVVKVAVSAISATGQALFFGGARNQDALLVLTQVIATPVRVAAQSSALYV